MNGHLKLSEREWELFARFVAKSNPPPILHRYRRVSDWTIKELATPEVHVAGVDDMNDPFEYRAPLHIDVEKLRDALRTYAQKQLGMSAAAAEAEANVIGDIELEFFRGKLENLRASSGLVCATSDPRSNRMWAYYGDGHRGICISYSTAFAPFCFAREVSYSDPSGSIDLMDTLSRDPSLLSDHVSCRKGTEWAFEQEYRIPVGPFPSDHTRLLPISTDSIIEIRLGAKILPDFKAKALSAMKSYPKKPRIIQMGCDHQTFRLTETAV
jgi:hypothetical protein